MSDNRIEEKDKTNLFSGVGRLFKSIGNIFSPEEERDYPDHLPVDISLDPEDIPPIFEENENDFTDEEETHSTPFEESLSKILTTLTTEETKQIFVDFIKEKEVDRLTPFEIETLDSTYHHAINILAEKRKKYDEISGSTDPETLGKLLQSLKADNNVSLFAKQNIVKNVLKRLSSQVPVQKGDQALLIKNYKIFSQRLDWELKGEKQIIGYTVKTLTKVDDPKERYDRLVDLAPFIKERIKDKKLQAVSRELFKNLLDFYNQLNTRITSFSNESTFDEDLELDDNNLPDFGAEEEAFLNKLAQKDGSPGIASEIDVLPEEKKADIIREMGFDPRFDRYFNEIVELLSKEDLGKLIGKIIMRVKDIEQTRGRAISMEYITDLISRLIQRLGKDHIIVLKVKNIKAHLENVYRDSASKLESLQRRLEGKTPYQQIQILKEISEEPGSHTLFGTIRNLERITVEKHFDDIFSGLPLETQKVVAEGLLSDLVALKNFHPHLISRLESKLGEVTILLKNKDFKPGEIDNNLINQIVDYASKPDSPETKSPAPRISKNATEKGLDEIKELKKEIDALSSLSEKITTLRFWLVNNYYSDKPQTELFIKNLLESYEQTKAREGGLIRDLFDELRNLDSVKQKILFLEEKIKDPVYFHLKTMLRTLIGNITENTEFAPENLTKEWILNQLRQIPDSNRKIDWLRIRRYLSPFAEFSDFINHLINRFEISRQEELEEHLEEKMYKFIQIAAKNGKEQKIYKNIISLTRAALSFLKKIQRRKLIKAQEILYPLDEQDRFSQQRKLLYYLLNTENDDIPFSRLHVLANKVLLSLNEKKDYLALLKLSRYKIGNETASLQDELNLTDEDIAYYAAYILGFNKPGIEQWIQHLENIKNDKTKIDDITITNSQGNSIRKDYKEFFAITPVIIEKVIRDLKKKVPDKIKSRIVTLDKKAESPGEKNSTSGYEETEEKDSFEPSQHIEDEEQEDNEVTQTSERSEEYDSAINSPEDESEDESEDDTPDEFHNKQYPDAEEDNASGNSDISSKKTAPHTHTSGVRKKQNLSPENKKEEKETGTIKHDENKSRETVYEENKAVIDQSVREDIIEEGVIKSRDVAPEMKIEAEKSIVEKELPFPKRIARLMSSLAHCFPEAVPELINKTIIPVFVDKGNDEGRDIFNAINQNLFIPALLNGADVDVDTTIDSIESFLGKKGIFFESREIIHTIVNDLKSRRSNGIEIELNRKINGTGKVLIPSKQKPKTIVHVLQDLATVRESDRIILHLENTYLIPLSQSSEQGGLYKECQTLRSLLNTQKAINWQKVSGAYGEEAVLLIKQIKQTLAMQPHTSVPGHQKQTVPDHQSLSAKEKISIPETVEQALSGSPVFIDPHKIMLKMASKDETINTLLGGDNDSARQHVIETLFRNGKIFTWDQKHYIGYGKLAHYIYDKDNKDYNKKQFAESLIAFLSGFPNSAMKAEFMGIEESEYERFYSMLQGWIAALTAPRDKSGDKTTRNTKGHQSQSVGNNRKNLPDNQEKSKKTSPSHSTSHIQERRTSDRRKTIVTTSRDKERRTRDRRETDRHKSTKESGRQNKQKLSRLTSKGESLLKRAERLLTDKLLLLIKMYNTKETMKMLYESYLSPSSERKNRLNLLNQKNHPAIYNAIKDDEAVLERLRIDSKKVMKQYQKKMKKLNK
ncbi:MAG: hypothetical protein JXJ04_13620 [Spirochaetales bacterium]|nr:hypothetical protein [Spirochaetales bacterium]